MDISEAEPTRPVKLDAEPTEDTIPSHLGSQTEPAGDATHPAEVSSAVSTTAVTQRINIKQEGHTAENPTGGAIHQPEPPNHDEPPVIEDLGEEDRPHRGKAAWLGWTLFGFLALLVVAAISGFSGYQTAVGQRNDYHATAIAGDAKTQFDLAVEDYLKGNYAFSKQRLEYVIQLDPNYPGALDLLANVIVAQQTTETPTPAPTLTQTPTPTQNLALITHEELFVQALQKMAGADWSNAIDTLLTLRKLDPELHTVQIDGMLYVCLRQRGVDKISKQADLEGGIYDLSLAERFGPLDVEANAWREWSQLYIRGASFWEVDWGKAVNYFSQIAPIAPNLRDGSGWTATDRYRIALVRYGDWLAARGDWCAAQEQYALALALLPDPEVEPTATYAVEQCGNGGDDGEPVNPPDGDATPTATLEVTPEPTEEVTPEPTEENTPEPTATSETPYP